MGAVLSETLYFSSDSSMIDYFNFKEKVTNFTWDMQLRDRHRTNIAKYHFPFSLEITHHATCKETIT